MKITRFSVILSICVLALLSPYLCFAQKDSIKLGYVVSKTGKMSTEGNSSYIGMEIWVETVNAQGGIFVKALEKKVPVKLIWYDDYSDPSASARLYEKLIVADKADILIGPYASGQSFASTAVTEKHKCPIVLTSAASDAIYERGYKYIFQGGAMLTSRLAPPYGSLLAKYKDKIKTVGIAYEDFLFTLSLYKEMKKTLTANGVNIVMEEKYPLAATDFSSLLMKVKSTNPDGIVLINMMPCSIYFTRQMAEFGLQPKFFAINIGPFQPEYVTAVGKLGLGVFETGWWDLSLPHEGARQFSESYGKKTGKVGVSDADAAHSFRAGQIWEQVLAKAKTLDNEEFNRILHSETFSTIEGKVKYNEKGINENEVGFLAQTQKVGTQRELVWPESIATQKPIIPYPYFK